MKRLIALVGMLCALVAAYPAAADYENNRRDQRYERDDRRYERERGEQRDDRRDRGFEREQRGERLSPDQRRQLRRDIEDLGRDVYRERGRRGRQ